MPGEIDAAKERARRLYRSPGYRRAYVRGVDAALRGLVAEANPYPNDIGWRHNFWLAWKRGWLSIATERWDIETEEEE